ncbi:hypothetical protein DFQ30_002618, partial [Apophysomyces sp. BC1015]
MAKLLFVANDSGNSDLYSYTFATNKQIYERLEKADCGAPPFGGQRMRRIDSIPQKGRWLWFCTVEAAVTLQETEGPFRFHCSNAVGNWVNVGYVRKSHTSESEESRIRLLRAMMTRLVIRRLCTKLFASPCSSSTEGLLERDCPKPDILVKLNSCNGDTQ